MQEQFKNALHFKIFIHVGIKKTNIKKGYRVQTFTITLSNRSYKNIE